jgi:hypothetical protein
VHRSRTAGRRGRGACMRRRGRALPGRSRMLTRPEVIEVLAAEPARISRIIFPLRNSSICAAHYSAKLDQRRRCGGLRTRLKPVPQSRGRASSPHEAIGPQPRFARAGTPLAQPPGETAPQRAGSRNP